MTDPLDRSMRDILAASEALFHYFKWVGRRGAKRSGNDLPLDRLSGRQVLAIGLIRQLQARGSGQVNLSDLAREMDVSGASASAMVERLVKKGLLVRRLDPNDRRQIRITLSESLEGDFLAMEEAQQDAMRALAQALGPETIARWRAIMGEVRSRLDEAANAEQSRRGKA
ncbi:MAG: MarR family protein [candidate division BRC1 bacterium ADurb.BinA364]|nr:MAG: MarR family protein [candidate division BRC1 bacterium ADurb.BinA364]